jgi:hypothetical protein
MALIDDFRDEMITKLAFLHPRIDGIQDFTKIALGGQTMQYLQREIVTYSRRRDLCQAALDAVNAVLADGYPLLTKQLLPDACVDELRDELGDIEMVITQFLPLSFGMTIDLGNPANEP